MQCLDIRQIAILGTVSQQQWFLRTGWWKMFCRVLTFFADETVGMG